MELGLSNNIDDVVKRLKADRRQVPFAASRAMNAAGYLAIQSIKQAMPTRLDRPTKYTLNSLRLLKSSKEDLTAKIDHKNNKSGGRTADFWLSQGVNGGARRQKGFEKKLSAIGVIPPGWFVVPTDNAATDANGNWKQSQLRQVFLALGQGYDKIGRERLAKSAARNASGGKARKSAARFFVIQSEADGMHPGIYQRKSGAVICLATLQKEAPGYRRRMPFYQIANRVFSRQFDALFPSFLQKAMETAK